MKIIDLIEEKYILQKRFTYSFNNEDIIGVEDFVNAQRSKESFRAYQSAIKRFDEINDQLNQISSRTYIKIDDREISLATAMGYIRVGGRTAFAPNLNECTGFNPLQSAFGTNDIDLYYVIHTRIADQIFCTSLDKNSEELANARVIDPNGVLSKKEYYKNFETDYIVKLMTAVQKAIVFTEVK